MTTSLAEKIEKVSASLFKWDTAITITASVLAGLASMEIGKILSQHTDIYSTGVLGGMAAASVGCLADSGLRRIFKGASFGRNLEHNLNGSGPIILSCYGIFPVLEHPDYPLVLQHLKNVF